MRASHESERKNSPRRVSSSEGHRLWAETYDSESNPLLALESRILSGKFGSLEGKLFMDLACGTGRWAVHAQSMGAVALGADLSPQMLLCAVRKPGMEGRVVQGDCRWLPFRDGCVDVVILAFALGYIVQWDRIFAEIWRIVRSGGSVFFSDLHPEAIRKGWTRSFRRDGQVYEVESRPYTVEQLRAGARRAGLQEKEIWEARLDTPEAGIFERAGKSALFKDAQKLPAVLAVHWNRP